MAAQSLAALLAAHPQFASLGAKLLEQPEGDAPPALPCRACGHPVERLWSLGAWRKGECPQCAERAMRADFPAARAALVEHLTRRDLGDHLERHAATRVPMLSPVVDWLERGYPAGAWLLLVGPAGTGKTQQVVELVRAIHAADCATITPPSDRELWAPGSLGRLRDPSHRSRCVYTTEAQLIESLQPGGAREGDAAHYEGAALLIIDEAGRRTTWREWSATALWNVLDVRYGKGRPTVIISNFSAPQLRQRTAPPGAEGVGIWSDPYLFDRLGERLEQGRWELTLQGPSWRRVPQGARHA